MSDKITEVFLFDAFYGEQDAFRTWLLKGHGRLFGAYTEHLREEHTTFEKEVKPLVGDRLLFEPATVEHDQVVQTYLSTWLHRLAPEWKSVENK
jgi:hypothetical protein